jgi:hypothetical protein
MAGRVLHLNEYRRLMEQFWRQGVETGLTTAGTTPEQYLGFKVIDIECVHYHLAGVGGGFWFRLDDGRVVDGQGRPCNSDPSLYDAVIN